MFPLYLFFLLNLLQSLSPLADPEGALGGSLEPNPPPRPRF